MVAKDHREIARSVIAEAEKAVAELGGAHDARADRLVKLHDLFTVVEQRYLSQQKELIERDEQIRILAEANDELIQALRSLTDAAQSSARRMGNGNDDLVRAVERSEALVARAFGTGGNANPTQAPDAPPQPDALDLEEVDTADEPLVPGDASDPLELEPADDGSGTDTDGDGDDQLLTMDGDAADGGAAITGDEDDADVDMLGHDVGGGASLDDEVEPAVDDSLGDDEDPDRLADLAQEASEDGVASDASDEDHAFVEHMEPAAEEADDESSDDDVLAFVDDDDEAGGVAADTDDDASPESLLPDSAPDDDTAADLDEPSSDSEVAEEPRPFPGDAAVEAASDQGEPTATDDPSVDGMGEAEGDSYAVDGAECDKDEREETKDEQDEKPLIEWSGAWSVGAQEMDRDHRILINLVNQLPEAFKDGQQKGWIIGSVLNRLWDYTEYHFNREEALQKAANFPGAEDHAGRHQELKGQVRDWLDRYQADPEAIDGAALLTFLKDWLVNHILGEDMRYKPYVENNPDAQAVAAAIPVDPELVDDLVSSVMVSEAAG